jgi:hypothetical protein
MRKFILVVLFLLLGLFVLEHSFFVMRTGVLLLCLAVAGCVCYAFAR